MPWGATEAFTPAHGTQPETGTGWGPSTTPTGMSIQVCMHVARMPCQYGRRKWRQPVARGNVFRTERAYMCLSLRSHPPTAFDGADTLGQTSIAYIYSVPCHTLPRAGNGALLVMALEHISAQCPAARSRARRTRGNASAPDLQRWLS